MVKALQYENC